ncbi:SAM-dependent methyltransferase [Nonomuraea sp. NPDC048892]|uniref:SAM-dependent methyltransferase n=1 Tax=Nonomuraea sp. NPDC048892 TaxID=3154624 RepID=UPI0033DA1E69
MERESLGFDPSTPSVARLYDYFLGGKDNFAADRAAAEKILEVAPELPAAARANRAFLGRAVRHLARNGITQFLDLGTGLPAPGNVHEVAQEVDPGARVVYVDHDPVVLVHARALLEGQGGTTVVHGDLREPGAILREPGVLEAIDFGRPLGVLLVAVMHHLADSDRPGEVVAALREAVAPGSFLVMSHGTSEARPAAVERCTEVYRSAGLPLTPRDRDEIGALFEGFELVDPGLVWLPQWRPDLSDMIDFAAAGPQSSLALCGVGVKR